MSSINRVLRNIGTPQPGEKEMNPYMLEKYGILTSPNWARNAPWYTGSMEYDGYAQAPEDGSQNTDVDKKGEFAAK